MIGMACVPILVLDDAHISGGILGEKGVVGEDGGEEKKTSRGDKMPGVLRCLPIIETPMAGCGMEREVLQSHT